MAALASSPPGRLRHADVALYPLAFISGLYFPLTAIHSELINEIAKVLPTGAGVKALRASFSGHSPGAGPLFALVGSDNCPGSSRTDGASGPGRRARAGAGGAAGRGGDPLQ
jgi:hypothetical protein